MARRELLIAGSALGGAAIIGVAPAAQTVAQTVPTFDVTDPPFGADPTGTRDSTAAFQAVSAAVTAASGGRVLIPPGSYRVGQQTPSRDKLWSFKPESIIEIRDCGGPVTIDARGAKLFVQPGLRFGSFDPKSGREYNPRLPFTDTSFRASPYIAMIALHNNRGQVLISGIELVGGRSNYRVGGPWNDHGIQINNSGIEAYGNRRVRVENVYSHHHGLDGIMIGYDGLTPDQPAYPHVLLGCRLEDNGRQGLSWVGGNWLEADNCTFARNGIGRIVSSPGAGVDIEPENSVCTNARFRNCVFRDNGGVGMIAHLSGPCENHVFSDCKFIGTRNWSAWPAAPLSRFERCLFAGGTTNAHASEDPSRATVFNECRFSADPITGGADRLFSQNYLTVEMDSLRNVRFNSCRFDSPPEARKGVVYANGGQFSNCRFIQRGTGLAVMRSTFRGTTSIDTAGTLDFSSARFIDPVVVNGQRVR